MITKEEVNKAWKKYYSYRSDVFGGPGNGCDDYRGYPDEVYIKLRALENNAKKLQKEYEESQLCS